MGGATVFGRLYGGAFANKHIYGSWWFISLWALLVVLSLLYLVQQRVYKRIAVMLLHVSFMVILVGALVTHLSSESGSVHLRKGEDVMQFVNGEGGVVSLPFVMTMTGFEIVNYPGTDAVMDYCCTIDVKENNESERMSVSMNNIGKVSGYRFYQASYDCDYEGSVLLVAHDPYGISITYFGYLMLMVSLLWVMCSKQTRIRQLYRQATKPITIFLLLFVVSSNVNAQEKITPVNREIADELGRIAVLYNGRICPLNTAATEFVTKLTGKGSWNGYNANEVFVGWMVYYTQWESQRIVKVKSDEVQHLIGINGKWASVRDFYNADHTYKLSGKANDLNAPSSIRKAIRETDEKLQVISMFYNSEMLHIFPLSVNNKLTWYTPGSTELPLDVPEAEFQFINHVMDQLTECILVSDVARAKELIAKIRLYQREKAGDLMPSSSTLRLEVFYNALQQKSWVTYLFLTLSLILCLFHLSMSARNHRKGAGIVRIIQLISIVSGLIWLTVIMALRWWLSGHAPMSNGAETMLFMAWTSLATTLLLDRKMPVFLAFGPVVAGFCMLVATLAANSPQITNLMPVLQSPLLTIHVAVIMIAYALFAIITLMAIYGLALCKMRLNAELERMTALSSLLLYPAVTLLTMGIFIGAVWANVSWGTYWSWDPKETWALITLMIYAVPLHKSFKPATDYKYHLYVLIAFLAVLMTYFGVNYFLPGMHSYA